MGNAQASPPSKRSNSETPVAKRAKRLRQSTEDDVDDEYEIEEVVEEVEVQEIPIVKSSMLAKQDSRLGKSQLGAGKMSFGRPANTQSMIMINQSNKSKVSVTANPKKKPSELYKLVGKAERFATSALALLQNEKLNSSLKDPTYWKEYEPKPFSPAFTSDYIPLPSEMLSRGPTLEQNRQVAQPAQGLEIDSKMPLLSLESNPYRQTTGVATSSISQGVGQTATEPAWLKPLNPFKQSTEESSRPLVSTSSPPVANFGIRQPANPNSLSVAPPLPSVTAGSGFFQSRLPPAQAKTGGEVNQGRVGLNTQPPAADSRGIVKEPVQVPEEQDGLEYSQITSPYPEHPKYRIGKPTSHSLGKHQCHEGCDDCMSELEQQDAVTVRQTTAQQVTQAKEQLYAEFMAQLQREELPNNNQENFMRLYSPSGSVQEEDSVPTNQISGRLRSKGRDLLGDTSSQIVRTMERTLNQGLGVAEPAVVTPKGVKTVVTKTTTKDKHGNTLPHHIVKFVSENAGSKNKDLVYQIDEYQAKNYLGKPKAQPGGTRLASTKVTNPVSPRTNQLTKKTKETPALVRPEDFWPNPKKFTEKPLPRFELTELQRLSVEAESMRHSLSYVTPKYDPQNLNFNMGTLQGHRRDSRGSGRSPNPYVDDSSNLYTPNSKDRRGDTVTNTKQDRYADQRTNKRGLILNEMTPEQIEKKVADSLRDFKFD